MRYYKTILICTLAILILSCQKNNNNKRIDIGVGVDIEEMEYRLISSENNNGEFVKKTHNDIAQLTMDTQSGRALGKWVYLPVSSCNFPSLRGGLPSVECWTLNMSLIIVVAPDNVREVLLNIERLRKVAYLKAKVIGVAVPSKLVISVHDPNTKMPVEEE